MFLVPGKYKPLVASRIIDYYVNWDLNLKTFIKLAIGEGLILVKTIKYYHRFKTPPLATIMVLDTHQKRIPYSESRR